jgi:hypothetical protein
MIGCRCFGRRGRGWIWDRLPTCAMFALPAAAGMWGRVREGRRLGRKSVGTGSQRLDAHVCKAAGQAWKQLSGHGRVVQHHVQDNAWLTNTPVMKGKRDGVVATNWDKACTLWYARSGRVRERPGRGQERPGRGRALAAREGGRVGQARERPGRGGRMTNGGGGAGAPAKEEMAGRRS